MNFRRIGDELLIRSIATHPKVWPTIGDDLVGDPANWRPVLNDGIWYVLAEEVGGEDAGPRGLFIFFPENSVCWQIHVCMLPKYWGSADRAMREVFEWIWERTPCRRIVGSVPVWNAPAVHCAMRARMEPFGVNQRSSLKYSRLHHQVLFGISKPEKAA